MPHRFINTSTNILVKAAREGTQNSNQHQLDTDQQIQALLQVFNQGVEASFSAGGVGGLREYTTAEGYKRMQEKYARWTNQQVTALNLVSCEFLAFDLDPKQQTAKAFTFEKWVFKYADGKEVPTAGAVDGYILQCIDGQWRVDSARTYALTQEG